MLTNTKSASMLIIERTYGHHIETLIWSDFVVRLARKWGLSRQTIYEWRERYPRSDDVWEQVRCKCGNVILTHENNLVHCDDCGHVTRWITAHARYIRG